MADHLATLRWALGAYLALVAALGLATVGWSVAEYLAVGGATIATAWFGLAGSGTLLVAVLLLRHLSANDLEPAI